MLQPYLLKRVAFKCDNKVIKTGKIKLFSIKQYFIRFHLENDKREIKQFELPYPYIMSSSRDICTFNYHVTSFAFNGAIQDQLKDLENDNMMRMYDRVVEIVPIE